MVARWSGVGVCALAALALATGCAGGTSTPAADAPPAPDAMARPDAPPLPVTLTQVSDSQSIVPGSSIGCINQATLVARENSWYRAFTLTEHGVNGGFTVSAVTFAIESAQGRTGGTQPATVKIYRYAGGVGGTLDLGAMTVLGSAPIQIADVSAPELRTVPIVGTVAVGEDLVVELTVDDSDPDNDGTGNVFFPGSNSAGQSKPPYLRAPVAGCDLASPTQLTLVGPGFPDMHLILTVTGVPD